MTRTQKWSAGTALVVVLVLVAGWMLLVSPTRANADDLHTQSAAKLAENAALSSKIDQLKAAQLRLPAQQAKVADIRQRIPQTPDLPALVRSLAMIASTTGVTLNTLSPAPPAPPAAAAATTATAASVTGPDGSQLNIIGLTLEVQGTYSNVERFFSRLESLKRSVLVTGFNMIPSGSTSALSSSSGAATAIVAGESPTLKVTINARVFMSAVPAPAATPTPTPTPAPTTAQ